MSMLGLSSFFGMFVQRLLKTCCLTRASSIDQDRLVALECMASPNAQFD